MDRSKQANQIEWRPIILGFYECDNDENIEEHSDWTVLNSLDVLLEQHKTY